MAILVGGLLNSIEYLGDTQHISTSLNSATADYWPPYATDLIPKTGATTTYVLASPVTWSISGGMGYSYFYDYYFRIHLSTYQIALGNILTDITYNVYVWNSYFTSDVLSSISEFNLPELSITSSITLPHTFLPLEEGLFTLNLPVDGIPTLDGNIVFNFNSENTNLSVTGQRVKVWPFCPLVSYSETKEYKTDIIETYGGETRIQLKNIPRSKLSYEFLFKDHKPEIYALAKEIARKFADYGLAIPLWMDITPVSSATAGQTSITVSTSYREFFVGQTVLLYKSYNLYDIYEIQNLTSISVTFTQTIITSYSNCFLIPLKIGQARNGFSFEKSLEGSRGSLSIITDDNTYSAAWPNSEIFKTLPVISARNILSSGLPEVIARDIEYLDNELGTANAFYTKKYTRLRQVAVFKAKNSQELYSLRRLVDYLKGKYSPFWMPTFQNEIKAVSTSISLGATNLIIYNAYWYQYGVQNIRVEGKDGTTINIEILSSANNNDGTETLQFAAATTKAISSIRQIMILTKVRSETDVFEFSYESQFMVTLKIPVIEVLS